MVSARTGNTDVRKLREAHLKREHQQIRKLEVLVHGQLQNSASQSEDNHVTSLQSWKWLKVNKNMNMRRDVDTEETM